MCMVCYRLDRARRPPMLNLSELIQWNGDYNFAQATQAVAAAKDAELFLSFVATVRSGCKVSGTQSCKQSCETQKPQGLVESRPSSPSSGSETDVVTEPPSPRPAMATKRTKRARRLTPKAKRSILPPKYSLSKRLERVAVYRAKRLRRNWDRSVQYRVRKTLADDRPRVSGRFIKTTADSDQKIPPTNTV